MKPEQRLLLALSLTLGILMAWSAITPPPPPPQTPPSAPATVQEMSEERSSTENEEPSQKFTVGSLELFVGAQSAGIKKILSNGQILLADSKFGLLQINSGERGKTTPQFQTDLHRGILTATALLEEPAGIEIIREIAQSELNSNYLLNIKLYIKNRSSEERKLSLRLLAYRPLPSSSFHQAQRQYQQGFALVGEKMISLPADPKREKIFPGPISWVSSQGKSTVLILKLMTPAEMFHVEQSSAGTTLGWLGFKEIDLPPGGTAEHRFLLYAGPMDLRALKEANLDRIITFGAFSGIAKLLLSILVWGHRWFHNYGISILFLGFGIWALFFPLTWSGVRMMRVMSHLQPQVERIRKEFSKNPQRMNKELLELYRKHRVNPLSGCLPLLLQMPIFIALYQVLTRSVQLEGAGFLWIRDLSAPDALIRFASAIPLVGESFNLLPVLMVAAMFVQQKMTTSTQVTLTEEQAMQQKMFKWFPLLFGVMFYSLPSGLVLYWVTNTVLTLIQQFLALRHVRA